MTAHELLHRAAHAGSTTALWLAWLHIWGKYHGVTYRLFTQSNFLGSRIRLCWIQWSDCVGSKLSDCMNTLKATSYNSLIRQLNTWDGNRTCPISNTIRSDKTGIVWTDQYLVVAFFHQFRSVQCWNNKACQFLALNEHMESGFLFTLLSCTRNLEVWFW
jgi:hypothetical protein